MALMTRFCAGEDSSWLAAKTQPARQAPPRSKTAMASSDVIDTNPEAMVIMPMTPQSMPDSPAPSPASGRNHTKETIMDHPAWTAYSIARARYMAPQTNQPIIPIEIVGFLNRPAN